VELPNSPVLEVPKASSGEVVEVLLLLLLLELLELLELLLPLELFPDEPLVPEPEVEDPPLEEAVPDDDCELLLVAAGRYMTERTSSSMRRRTARASCARSTSAWPAEEYFQYRLSPE